ncbi:hypothetical protein D9M70_536810 [compost metagenome]
MVPGRVGPFRVGDGIPHLDHAQRWVKRPAADIDQHIGRLAGGEDRQVQIVVAHQRIDQRMGLLREVVGSCVDREAMADLFHLVAQALPGDGVQFVAQGQVGEYRQQDHQRRAHQDDRESEAEGQARRLHPRSSST